MTGQPAFAPPHGHDAPSTGLAVARLTKRFTPRGKPVLSEVSFDAPRGGITTLLGPSGSGKSTVLRLVAGLESPDQGTVSIGGHDVTSMPAQRREVGFVFQGYALFRHMTVRENVAFGLHVRHLPGAEVARRVDALLATVELDGYGERTPAQLSGGQRQRVAFARALAIEPKVLLLDEPFAALDAKVRASLRGWLRRFHEERAARGAPPVTTLLVTHDQDEAMELSEHVVVLNDGVVEQAGAPRDVYDHPATPFVASFFGGANVFSARVERGRISTGAMGVPVTDGDATSAAAFVRPHEVKLLRADDVVADEHNVVVARVERLAFLGAYVKVTLRLPEGGSLVVESSKAEIDALGVAEGERVMADLRDARLFVGDYSI